MSWDYELVAFFVLADQKTHKIAYMRFIWYQSSSKHIAHRHGGENDFSLSTMLRRFRILAYAARNEKDKEQW